jgi:ferredoxin
MMIPDLATSEAKFVEAVERGNAVCRKYFPYYTLYCVGIKLRPGLPRYEMSCIPPDAADFGWGCEFEPMLAGSLYSRDYLQSFKNEIYDIGVEMKLLPLRRIDERLHPPGLRRRGGGSSARAQAGGRPGDDPQRGRGVLMQPLSLGDVSFGDPERPGYEDCTGCNVCVLPCPVWRETHDITLTLAGRAKALQRGVSVESLAVSLDACVLCGACEPVCPVEIDTVGMTLDLRKRQAETGGSALATAAAKLQAPAAEISSADAIAGATWFLPGRALQADPARLRTVTALFESSGAARVAADDGADLASALEAGLPIDVNRRERFLRPLLRARELIVGDGLLHRTLREWLPEVRVIGIGEALLRILPVRAALKPGDFYVIETRGYHAEFGRLVKLYDGLRQSAGCAMNLDLQRAAIPTGAASLQALLGTGGISLAGQTRWIVEGRKIDRIVIEDAADRAPFEQLAIAPVVHLAELAVAGAPS